MIANFQDYIETVKSGVAQRILKLEVLDNNEEVVSELYPDVLSGDLQLSSDSGARRNCNIVFNNDNGKYIPNVNSFWINSKFRLHTGYKVNNEDYYIKRGIFVCGEPNVKSNGSEQIVELSLFDKFCLLNGELGGTLEADYIVNVGERIENVIRAIFQSAGEIKMPIIYPTTESTPFTITKEAGSTYADIIADLCNMLSWVCYYDSNGYPHFEPPTNIDTKGASWDFTTKEIHYLSSDHKFEFGKIRNHVVVIGDNINGSLVRATASDTNPLSPTRIGLIGKKVLVITDDIISTNQLAQDRANYELLKAISLVETVNLECIPIDFIEPDDIITIYDEGNGLNKERYLIKSISFPLMNDGNQQMSCWKGRQLQ